MVEGSCDFCSEEHAAKVYPCETFIWEREMITHQSLGGWAACAECSRLIDANEWDALVERSIYQLVEQDSVPIEHVQMLRENFHQIYALFRTYRK